MAREKSGAYNLIAAFVDMSAAQHVLEELKAEGVPAQDVSLICRQSDEAVATDDRQTEDRASFVAAAKGTVAGAVGGGVLGGAAGFLLGLAAFAVPGVGPVIGAGVWAATGLGAIAGAGGGAFVGAITGTELSSQRTEAYQTHLTQGHALVGVHADSSPELERAFEVVARSQPLEIDRYGSGVRPRA